jgi:hypothetical protein
LSIPALFLSLALVTALGYGTVKSRSRSGSRQPVERPAPGRVVPDPVRRGAVGLEHRIG